MPCSATQHVLQVSIFVTCGQILGFYIFAESPQHPNFPSLKVKVQPLLGQASPALARRQHLQLRCEVTSESPIEVGRLTWTRGDRDNAREVSIQNQVLDVSHVSSVLTIREVEEEDFGGYECNAANTAGEVASGRIRIERYGINGIRFVDMTPAIADSKETSRSPTVDVTEASIRMKPGDITGCAKSVTNSAPDFFPCFHFIISMYLIL
ncbi:hypothetical protein CAPTEDRAFT_211013 [Capitella teleta]|uniref:Ig-like domain-containing protein n=1 Tax=Capitella teleta TaxID=283909 RepID=R7VE60_CAPTE|nr:hypothetical protein CAPTEDRAFT_211013 [Capitella teleta]|eukprot:ELU14586.1 hypothetical protein CAPTEDRAFT_211013 [Capitella teleta]